MASRSLDQLIFKPNSLSLMGTFVGSPGVPLKILVIWVMHSSLLFVTPHHDSAPEIHSTSSVGCASYSQPVPGRLAIPAGTTSGPCKAPTGAPTNLPAALHSVLPPECLRRGRASPPHSQLEGTHSLLSMQPRSRLGVRGQHPHLTLPPGGGFDVGSQQRLLRRNPRTNPASMLLIPSEGGGFSRAVNLVFSYFL